MARSRPSRTNKATGARSGRGRKRSGWTCRQRRHGHDQPDVRLKPFPTGTGEAWAHFSNVSQCELAHLDILTERAIISPRMSTEERKKPSSCCKHAESARPAHAAA